MAESVVSVVAKAGVSALKKISSSLRLVYNEPCPWSIVLDNSQGDYNEDQAIANPRTFADVLSLEYNDGLSSFISPDLLIDDYDYDTQTVSIAGQCRLSQLDKNDQFIDAGDGTATFEDTNVAAVLGVISASYGLTVSGAPARVVKTFQAVGSPLQMFRDLLYPTHVFRMGTGTQIVCEPVTSNGTGPTYVDRDHVEILKFKRTTDVYNKATVERVVEHAGIVTLVNSEQTHGDGVDLLAGQINVTFSEPSRSFSFLRRYAKRGVLDQFVLKDAGGNPVGATPYPQKAYVGNTPIASVGFQYTLNIDSGDFGPFTPELSLLITGYPATTIPPETEAYSATATAGAGDRPYPEPFTSLTIESQSDAQAAADALVSLGTRQGNILNFSTRLNPAKIPYPNEALNLTDYLSGLSGTNWICESVQITESEDGDTGTINIEATRAEA